MGLFYPLASQNLSVTTTSASVTYDAQNGTVRVVNTGTGTAFIAFGNGSATATASSMAILAGSIEVFYMNNMNTLAAITGSGTTTLNITIGNGV